MPKRADLSDTFCPVGRSAELLGDRAVLLILRTGHYATNIG